MNKRAPSNGQARKRRKSLPRTRLFGQVVSKRIVEQLAANSRNVTEPTTRVFFSLHFSRGNVKVLTCPLVSLASQLLRDFVELNNRTEGSISLVHNSCAITIRPVRFFTGLAMTMTISRANVVGDDRDADCLGLTWFPERGAPFLADERAGTEAHVKVSRATSSDPAENRLSTTGTSRSSGLLPRSVASRVPRATFTHNGGRIRGRGGGKRRRRRRRDAPARLGGNAKPGATFNRDTPSFCPSSPASATSLYPPVFTSQRLYGSSGKVDDCHLTILLAPSQRRFEFVADIKFRRNIAWKSIGRYSGRIKLRGAFQISPCDKWKWEEELRVRYSDVIRIYR